MQNSIAVSYIQCSIIVWIPSLDIFFSHIVAAAKDSHIVSLEKEALENRSELESFGKFPGRWLMASHDNCLTFYYIFYSLR